jgi:hypothetical protein
MFQRVAYEGWQTIFPIIGFTIFFVVFVGGILRILFKKKSSVTKLENLPFEEEGKQEIFHGKR